MNCVKIDSSYPRLREWLDLIGRSFDGINPAWIYDFLRSPDILLLAAEEEGALSGTVCMRFTADWEYLMLLAAVPEKRGRGIGTALFQKAAAEAEDRGLRGLLWECLGEYNFTGEEDIRTALRRRAFYERLGGRTLEGRFTRIHLPEMNIYPEYRVMYYLTDRDADPGQGARQVFGEGLIIK